MNGGYPEDWDEKRKKILQRDEYACQKCGRKNTELHVHHRTPISRGGSHNLTNLITLCSSCHENQHPIKSHLKKAIEENRTVKIIYSNKNNFRSWRLLDPYELVYHKGLKMEFLVGYDRWKNEIRYFRPKRISSVSFEGRFRPPANFDAKSFVDSNFQFFDQKSAKVSFQYSDQNHPTTNFQYSDRESSKGIFRNIIAPIISLLIGLTIITSLFHPEGVPEYLNFIEYLPHTNLGLAMGLLILIGGFSIAVFGVLKITELIT